MKPCRLQIDVRFAQEEFFCVNPLCGFCDLLGVWVSLLCVLP